MSIMGRVYLTCDSKGCHGEEIIEAEDFDGHDIKNSLKVSAVFAGWTMDDEGGLHCAACNEERERPEPERLDLWILGGAK
jgi:hypothetical protein